MSRLARCSLAALLLAACAGAPPAPPPAPVASLPRPAPMALPADWRTLPSADFERFLLAALPEERATAFDESSRAALAAALDQIGPAGPEGRGEPLALRAALLLARSRHPTSAALLIRRLERRVLGAERGSDCGDALAAAALARYPDPRRYAQRLVPLAVGSRPHPDLEVRVECAASALHAGFTEVVPFLLAVLRIDTDAGERDLRDFAVGPSTAWARGRAAEALSTFAEVPLTYRPEDSDAAREREAAHLAELLAARGVAVAGPAVR